MWLLLLPALGFQQPSQAPAPTTPIAVVVVQPAEAAIVVGDTIRLSAVARDSSGRPVDNAILRWFQSGGHFEGTVDSTGLVTGGATGTLTLTALMSPAAGGSPTPGFARVTVLSPPASRVAVEPVVTRMYVGQSLTMTAVPYAPNDDRRHDEVRWSSSAPGTLAVNAGGRLTALQPGRATITARAGAARHAFGVTVAANPVVSVALRPATASARTGDVVPLAFEPRSATGGTVADAAPEWSLQPGNGLIGADGRFVADLPGSYVVSATFAGRTAQSTIEVRPRDVRRPATLVGRLPLTFPVAEFWIHPDGRHAYITTIGDRLYALDIADPAAPRITDSVMVDARHINDVMTTEDGRFGVLTRENASTRKNGIVVLSFEDPAHPRPVSEFTETVTGGVHSTFIYKGYVYLTDDATGSMRVIDLHDPTKPRQVARWETPSPQAGRMLHDIDVQDGLAYLSVLERRTGHPRCGQWHEGRIAGESAAGHPAQVRSRGAVPRRGGGRWTRIHPGYPHGVAARPVCLRGRRSVSRRRQGTRKVAASAGSGAPTVGSTYWMCRISRDPGR